MKLFLKEVTDRYIQENFKRLQKEILGLTNGLIEVGGSTTYVTQRIPLDGSEPISGTIEPDTASTHDLGSTTKPLRGLYSDEIYLSGNSMYINGKKAIVYENNRVTYTSELNQDVEVKSRGTGILYIDAEGDIILTSNGDVTVNGRVVNAHDYGREIFEITSIVGGVITLAETPIINSDKIYCNGLTLTEGASYDYVRVDNVITFNSGVLTPDGVVRVDYAY